MANYYIENKKDILQICNNHWQQECENCPFKKACEIEKNPNESDADFAKRWESGMSEAYINFSKGG